MKDFHPPRVTSIQFILVALINLKHYFKAKSTLVLGVSLMSVHDELRVSDPKFLEQKKLRGRNSVLTPKKQIPGCDTCSSTPIRLRPRSKIKLTQQHSVDGRFDSLLFELSG